MRATFSSMMLAIAVPSSMASATIIPTGFTGGSVSFSQYQPSLVLEQLVATAGVYPPHGDGPDGGSGGSGTPYLGMVHTFAGTFEAFGAPAAHSQLETINSRTALFSLLGTQFGGDGRTTFALPDLTGRTVVGTGNTPVGNYYVGLQDGTPATVLSVANLPPHDHTLPGSGNTDIVGSGMPFDNHEPSLALTEMIAVSGNFPTASGPASHVFLGEVGQFAGNYVPAGWLPADGRLLSINANTALFSVIGATYGGDGRSTFALPDLRGRTAVGVGAGIGLAAVTLGEQFGTASTALTLAQLPAHDHILAGGGVTGNTGGSQTFDTHQPSLGLTYIISLRGDFPTRDGAGAFPDNDPYFGEVVAFAGNFAPGDGWALANGQLLSISQNEALFALLGTVYGGDGITTFALPDLRGRSVIGSGPGFDVGTKLGTDTTVLTVANLADHDHSVTIASVPEPATWALLMTGFGMTGAVVRRRSRATQQS